MRILIDNRHREYFKEMGQISFEEVFPLEVTHLIKEEIDRLIQKKDPDKFGHDLFRQSLSLKKNLSLRSLGTIVADLCEEKPVRIGFDQLFFNSSLKPKTLKEISSIQGLLMGILIDLDLGIVVCISPNTPFPEIPNKGYLLAFIGKDSVYIRNENDPFSNELKKLGYSFGDRLSDSTHPTICR